MDEPDDRHVQFGTSTVEQQPQQRHNRTLPAPPRAGGGGGGLISNVIGRAANPVLAAVDVDAIIQRVDVNELVAKVDWNAVVDEIDWNNLLDHIDLDALIDKIDVDRAVERVDVNALIERSNLKQILARSTSGMCSLVMNRFRALCIKVDQICHRTGRCAWCMFCWPSKQMWVLPPKPAVRAVKLFGLRNTDYKDDLQKRRQMRCPRKSTQLAQAVQGRNAGIFSRFLAYSIDRGLTVALSLLGIFIITSLVQLIPEGSASSQVVDAFTQTESQIEQTVSLAVNATQQEVRDALAEQQEAQQAEEEKERLLFGLALPVLVINTMSFFIDAVSMLAAGRTIGKAFMGLVVVNSFNGKVGHITVWQSICRSFLTNYFVILVWFGTPFSLVREDRRSLIDYFCSTTVIYAWDAKSFRMASDEIKKESAFGDMGFESDEEESIADSEWQSLAGSATSHSRSNSHHRKKGTSRVLAGNDYQA